MGVGRQRLRQSGHPRSYRDDGSSCRRTFQVQSQTTAHSRQRTLSKTKPHRAMLLPAQTLPPLRHSLRKAQTELQSSRRPRMLLVAPTAICRYGLGGHPQFIEVKTTNGSSRTPFFLTRNECDIARQYPVAWRIYRVHLFATGPRVFTIAPPLEINIKL